MPEAETSRDGSRKSKGTCIMTRGSCSSDVTTGCQVDGVICDREDNPLSCVLTNPILPPSEDARTVEIFLTGDSGSCNLN